MKKIEVFYKEDKCYIKDNFDDNLKITKAEKVMIDKINELIDVLNNITPTNAKTIINCVFEEQKGLKWK